MKNRSRLDIAAKILDVAQEGALKTRIMYDAFLSFPQLREYLDLLQSTGAINFVREEGKYYTTEKGRAFLSGYNKIGSLLFPKSSSIAAPEVIA